MTIIHAIRAVGSEPTLAEFQARLELAMRGGVILCTLGFTAEVIDALDAIARAAPDPAEELLDAAMDAFLRQAADPRPWYEKNACRDQ
jgi:hypothetical protein